VGNGNHDQGDEKPEPVATSSSYATSGTPGGAQAGVRRAFLVVGFRVRLPDGLDKNGAMSGQGDLRAASRAFIAAAFDVLAEQHVIPTPIFHPYVAVGRDYFGDSIGTLATFHALETQLNDIYPNRFAEPSERREFAEMYIFSFLEACIARCAHTHSFNVDSQAVDESIDELLSVLEAMTYEVVCCRHVSHLTTASGDEVQIGDVTVVPEPEQWGGLVQRIQREIRGAPQAWNREDPRPYDPPHSLLIIRETTDDPDPYAVDNRLSWRLERFLLLARLLTAGTVQSAYQVSGTTTLIARMDPLMRNFRKGLLDTLVRRTVRLTGQEAGAFAALGDLLDAADIKREGMVATSFDVALSKFNRSYSSDSPYEHLVDLATALEAVLIGTERDNEGLTLRLRTRVAALLATTDDPARALFDDVGQLYGLRSKIVHGGQIKQKELRKLITRISTVPAEVAEHRFGVALGYAVDRMRDLVRRAILARLCLAAGPNPLWPFDEETAVDSVLADDTRRVAWRERWHTRLAELGVEYAAGRPRSAVDFLSRKDR
jgi:hypothetical protein